MKLDYKKTFVLGLGFFAISILWPIYNAFVPVILEDYIKSGTLIGAIMTIDNVFAVVFQPLFGSLSDRTNNRYGRRMPYILVGVPVSALLFSIVPYTTSLVTMMAIIILMNFTMSIYRAPTVALMPDVTPRPLRSKANGVINFMGGLAAVLAYGVGGKLFDMNRAFPFHFASIIMIAALIILVKNIKEPMDFEVVKKEKKKVDKDYEKNKSLKFMLVAIFLWFTGFNVVETFFSLYGEHVLNITAGRASIVLTSFSLAFLIFAIPAGFIGTKIGRKRTILIGIIGILTIFVPMILLRNVSFISIFLVIGGGFWALININSYPMVVEMAPEGGVGAYTGYYYFFASSAAIVSPILFGFIKDLVGTYEPLFIYSCIAFILALASMIMVKHGDSDNLRDEQISAIDEDYED